MSDKSEYHSAIQAWLDKWSTAIASNNIEAGKKLFSKDTAGFGTITFQTSGLEDLVERQWQLVWSRTNKFVFEDENQVVTISDDGSLATVQSVWNSYPREDPGAMRRGRATIILRRENANADWQCIHTHFSLWPSSADQALGAPIT